MWILGLLFIISLTLVGFYTIGVIFWDLWKEGRRGMCEIEESKKHRAQHADWEAYLDRRFRKKK